MRSMLGMKVFRLYIVKSLISMKFSNVFVLQDKVVAIQFCNNTDRWVLICYGSFGACSLGCAFYLYWLLGVFKCVFVASESPVSGLWVVVGMVRLGFGITNSKNGRVLYWTWPADYQGQSVCVCLCTYLLIVRSGRFLKHSLDRI